MPNIQITPMATNYANGIWNGGTDAYGMVPERRVSDGDGIPCRHCLTDVPAGEAYLILSYRPFGSVQPFAEQGPIFLHADPCPAYAEGGALPSRYVAGQPMILRGYDERDRIVYGTGKVTDPTDITRYAAELLDREKIAYVHVRSSTNNCFAFRIDPAQPADEA
ncbi:DUF1203 domain-containing protein [Hwanghaeella grinnelliae]|uniref:DUF1203 domain-containing protein n=1 Tax=Hwanghaeella grinnelliae TaxID=2500179 RepID=A0A437QY54_9PROT|nr:DUF1203 domain-containing protein [Hwanghaeella grinnelliae]RVU39392.1 DUF1203 domain-containing protein [Hwanghaeella grinnelliae]